LHQQGQHQLLLWPCQVQRMLHGRLLAVIKLGPQQQLMRLGGILLILLL
jgi:hypothetical protein